MKQGIQNEIEIEAIQKDGCYFLCLLRWAEKLAGTELDIINIQTLYYNCVAKGYMEQDCFVINPPRIVKETLDYFAEYQQYKLLKEIDEVRITQEAPEKDIFIIYLKKPGYGHFVLSHNGKIWDSLPPDRAGAMDYHIDSYRELF